jgi:hypothetical protein
MYFVNTPTKPAVFAPTPLPPTPPSGPGTPEPEPEPPVLPPTVISKEGFVNGILYADTEFLILFNPSGIVPTPYINNLYYIKGVLANGTYSPTSFTTSETRPSKYFINGKLGEGTWIYAGPTVLNWGMKFKDDGNPLFSTSNLITPKQFSTEDLALKKYEGVYIYGCKYDTIVSGPTIEVLNGIRTVTDNKILYLYGIQLYHYANGVFELFTGLFRDLIYVSGNPTALTAELYDQLKPIEYKAYNQGYPVIYVSDVKGKVGLNLIKYQLYDGSKLAAGYVLHTDGILYKDGRRFSGVYEDKFYFLGVLATGSPIRPSPRAFFYINGIKLIGSDVGVTNPADNHWYQYGMKIISNGYFNKFRFINGVKQL